MCKMQTKLHDLLSCDETQFLIKLEELDFKDLQLLIKDIKQKDGIKKERESMK